MNDHAALNRIYRLVWSAKHGAMVPAPESQRGRGKASTVGSRPAQANGASWRGRALALKSVTLAAMSLMGGVSGAHAQLANNALPVGGVVQAGQVSISASGARMNVQQSSQRAVVDWSSFNVGRDAQVHFQQPNAQAAILNRVVSTQASQILGQITANGQVVLVNPAGIYFGRSATVNVGGLIASSHDISNADFMAGNMAFAGGEGSVVNEGELRAALGGYIALLAPEVQNEGVIIAQMGAVALAAGEGVTLEFAGDSLTGVVVEAGTLQALVENRGAVEAPGGIVIMSAKALNEVQGGVVRNSGSISASGMRMENGKIILEASGVIDNSGQITANGDGTAESPAGAIEVQAPVVHNSGTLAARVTSSEAASLPPLGQAASAPTEAETLKLEPQQAPTLVAEIAPSTALEPTAAETLVTVEPSAEAAGRVHIEALEFTQAAGAQIDVSNDGQGDAGEVVIQAVELAEIQGQVLANALEASGGQVRLSAQALRLEDAQVQAGGEQGGQVFLNALQDPPTSPSPQWPDEPMQPGLPTTWVGGASSLSAGGRRGTGGSIDILGDDVQLDGLTTVDASGADGGGQVRIGGDYQGANPEVLNASRTRLAEGVTVRADATQSGDGGRVIVWADERTDYDAHISARGGELGGDGGFAEVSGKRLLAFTGSVDLLAPQGAVGDLLLDPHDLTISGTGPSSGMTSFDASSDDSVLYVSDLTNALASANVTVTTGSTGTQAGNITVASTVQWFGATTLTLQAANNIAVNETIRAVDGNVVLTATGGSVTVAENKAVRLDAPGSSLTVTAAGAISGAGATMASEGAFKAGGTSSFTSSAGAVTLTSEDNSFGGAVSVSSASGAALTASGGLELGTVSITGALALSATSGNITQATGGTLAVTGALSAVATGSNNIVLPDVNGGITVALLQAGGSITLGDGDTGAMTLQSSTNGTAVVSGVAPATSVASGTVTLTADSIALNDPITTQGGSVVLTADTGALTSASDAAITTTGNVNEGVSSGSVTATAATSLTLQSITTMGASNAQGVGANAAAVTLEAGNGDLTIGGITTSGGAATTNVALANRNGGNAGNIRLFAPSKTIYLNGNLTAVGGAYYGDATQGLGGYIELGRTERDGKTVLLTDILLSSGATSGNISVFTDVDSDVHTSSDATADSGRALTITAGTGDVLTEGLLGSFQKLSGLNITSSAITNIEKNVSTDSAAGVVINASSQVRFGDDDKANGSGAITIDTETGNGVVDINSTNTFLDDATTFTRGTGGIDFSYWLYSQTDERNNVTFNGADGGSVRVANDVGGVVSVTGTALGDVLVSTVTDLTFGDFVVAASLEVPDAQGTVSIANEQTYDGAKGFDVTAVNSMVFNEDINVTDVSAPIYAEISAGSLTDGGGIDSGLTTAGGDVILIASDRIYFTDAQMDVSSSGGDIVLQLTATDSANKYIYQANQYQDFNAGSGKVVIDGGGNPVILQGSLETTDNDSNSTPAIVIHDAATNGSGAIQVRRAVASSGTLRFGEMVGDPLAADVTGDVVQLSSVTGRTSEIKIKTLEANATGSLSITSTANKIDQLGDFNLGAALDVQAVAHDSSKGIALTGDVTATSVTIKTGQGALELGARSITSTTGNVELQGEGIDQSAGGSVTSAGTVTLRGWDYRTDNRYSSDIAAIDLLGSVSAASTSASAIYIEGATTLTLGNVTGGTAGARGGLQLGDTNSGSYPSKTIGGDVTQAAGSKLLVSRFTAYQRASTNGIQLTNADNEIDALGNVYRAGPLWVNDSAGGLALEGDVYYSIGNGVPTNSIHISTPGVLSLGTYNLRGDEIQLEGGSAIADTSTAVVSSASGSAVYATEGTGSLLVNAHGNSVSLLGSNQVNDTNDRIVISNAHDVVLGQTYTNTVSGTIELGQAHDADAVLASVSVGQNAAIDLTGSGLYNTDKVVLNDSALVTIDSTGDESSLTFTVVGTSSGGDAITDMIAGPNAGSVTSSRYFDTISSITVSGGSTAGALSVGLGRSITGSVTQSAAMTTQDLTGDVDGAVTLTRVDNAVDAIQGFRADSGLSLSTDTDLSVYGAVTASNGSVTLTGTQTDTDIAIKANASVTANTVGTGAITISGGANNAGLTVDALATLGAGSGGVTLSSGYNDMQMDGDITSTGAVSLTANTGNSGAYLALADTASIDATAANITLRAGGYINNAADLTTTAGTVELTSSNYSGSYVTITGEAVINSGTGDIDVFAGGDLNQNGSLTNTSTASVTLETSTTTTSGFVSAAGSSVTAGSGGVSVKAGEALSHQGSISTTGGVTLIAAKNASSSAGIAISGNVTAGALGIGLHSGYTIAQSGAGKLITTGNVYGLNASGATTQNSSNPSARAAVSLNNSGNEIAGVGPFYVVDGHAGNPAFSLNDSTGGLNVVGDITNTEGNITLSTAGGALALGTYSLNAGANVNGGANIALTGQGITQSAGSVLSVDSTLDSQGGTITLVGYDGSAQGAINLAGGLSTQNSTANAVGIFGTTALVLPSITAPNGTVSLGKAGGLESLVTSSVSQTAGTALNVDTLNVYADVTSGSNPTTAVLTESGNQIVTLGDVVVGNGAPLYDFDLFDSTGGLAVASTVELAGGMRIRTAGGALALADSDLLANDDIVLAGVGVSQDTDGVINADHSGTDAGDGGVIHIDGGAGALSLPGTLKTDSFSSSAVELVNATNLELGDVNVINGTVALGQAAHNTAVAAAQAVAQDGTVTLAGDLSALNTTPSRLVIVGDGDESAVSFVVVGTDAAGSALTETITGPNNGAVATTYAFKTVSSITATGAAVTDISVGSIGANALTGTVTQEASGTFVVARLSGQVDGAVTLDQGVKLNELGALNVGTTFTLVDAGKSNLLAGTVDGLRFFGDVSAGAETSITSNALLDFDAFDLDASGSALTLNAVGIRQDYLADGTGTSTSAVKSTTVSITSGAGNLLLGSAGNDFTSDVTLVASGDYALVRDANNLKTAALTGNVAGATNLTLLAGGVLSLATEDIALTTGSFDLRSLGGDLLTPGVLSTTTGDVNLFASGEVTLAKSVTSSTNGDITVSGDSIASVAGTGRKLETAGSGDISVTARGAGFNQGTFDYTTVNGDVSVRASGTVALANVTSSTGNLFVNAGGAITQNTGSALSVGLVDAVATNDGAITLDESNDVDILRLRSRNAADDGVGSGHLTFTDSDGLAVRELSTSGNITLLAGGAVTTETSPTSSAVSAVQESRSGGVNETQVVLTNNRPYDVEVAFTVDTSSDALIAHPVQGGYTVGTAKTVTLAANTSAVVLTVAPDATGATPAYTYSFTETALGAAAEGQITANALSVKVLNDAATDVILSNAANDVDSINLRARDAADANDVGGTLKFVDADGFSVTQLQTTGNAVLTAGDAVTQTNALDVGGLGLLGAGSYTFDNSSNVVLTFASEATGAVTLVSSVDLVVGAVNPTGVTTSGADLTLTAPSIDTSAQTIDTRARSGGTLTAGGSGGQVSLTTTGANANGRLVLGDIITSGEDAANASDGSGGNAGDMSFVVSGDLLSVEGALTALAGDGDGNGSAGSHGQVNMTVGNGAIDQQDGSHEISAGVLYIDDVADGVNLIDATNRIDAFAATVSTADAAVTLKNTTALSIGHNPGTGMEGVTTNGGDVTLNNGSVAVTLNAAVSVTGGAGTGAFTSIGSDFTSNAGATVTTGSGDVDLTGHSGAVNLGANVTTNGGDVLASASSVTTLANAALSTSGGAVDFNGTTGAVSLGATVTTSGGLFKSTGTTFANTASITTASGAVNLVGHTGAVDIDANVTTGGGAFTATGATVFDATGMTISTQGGDDLAGGAIAVSTSAGNLTSGTMVSSGGTDTNGSAELAGGITLDATGSVITSALTAEGGTSSADATAGAAGAQVKLSATVDVQLGGDISTAGGGSGATQGAGGKIWLASDAMLLGARSLSTGGQAGDIAFDGSLDSDASQNRNLALTAGTGNITWTGAVGATDALGAVTVNAANDVTLSSTAVLGALTQATSGAGTVTVNGALSTETGGVSLDAAAIDINANINTATATTSGTVTLTGPTNLAAGITSSGAAVTFVSALTLDGTSSVTSGGGAVDFDSTVDGTETFTISSGAGHVSFDTTVGAGTALGALTVNSSGTTAFTDTVEAASVTTDAAGSVLVNGGAVTTSGIQSFGDAMTLGANTVLTGTQVTLGGTVSGAGTYSLGVAGNAIIDGAVSGVITVDVSGTTSLGANVSSSGAQTYVGAVTLDAAAVALSATDAAIDLQSSLDSASGQSQSLTVSAGTGSIDLTGAVGASDGLADLVMNSTGATTLGATVVAGSVTTNAGGTTVVTGNVTTAAGQTWNDAVTLMSDVSFTNSTSGSIAFNETVDAEATQAHDMTLVANTTNISLAKAMGGGVDGALGAFTVSSAAQLSTQADADVTASGVDITATSFQAAGDLTSSNASITVASDVTLTGDVVWSSTGIGAVSHTGDIDGAQQLDLLAGTGGISITGATGSLTALSGVRMVSGGTVAAGQLVVGDLSVNAQGAVTLTDATNDVDNLAVLVANSAAFSFVDVDGITIAELGTGADQVTGLSDGAGSSAVSLTAGGLVTQQVAAPIALNGSLTINTSAYTAGGDVAFDNSAGTGTVLGNTLVADDFTLDSNGNVTQAININDVGTADAWLRVGGEYVVNGGSFIETNTDDGVQGAGATGLAAGEIRLIGMIEVKMVGTDLLASTDGFTETGNTNKNQTIANAATADVVVTSDPGGKVINTTGVDTAVSAITLNLANNAVGGILTITTNGSYSNTGANAQPTGITQATADALVLHNATFNVRSSAANSDGTNDANEGLLDLTAGDNTFSGVLTLSAPSMPAGVRSAADLTLGNVQAGALTLNLSNLAGDTVYALSQAASTAVRATSMNVPAANSVSLQNANQIGTVGMDVSNAIALSNAQSLTIGAAGLTSGAGGINLSIKGDLTVDTTVGIDATAGQFTLTALQGTDLYLGSATGTGLVLDNTELAAITAGGFDLIAQDVADPAQGGRVVLGDTTFALGSGSVSVTAQGAAGVVELAGDVVVGFSGGAQNSWTSNSAVQVTADASIEADSATFESTVDSDTADTHGLTLIAGTEFKANVGETTALSALTLSDSLTLLSDLSLSASQISLQLVDADTAGLQGLTLNGNSSFNQLIGGAKALKSLTVNGGAALVGAATQVLTTGAQTYTGALSLDDTSAATYTLSSSNGGNIDLQSTIDGSANGGAATLVLNTSGATLLKGAIGATHALSAIETDADGSSTVSAASVSTSGAQIWRDDVTLGADTAWTASQVSLLKALTGATYGLAVTGDLDAVAMAGLGSLAVSGASMLGGDISSAGNQSYVGAVTLGQALSLTASTGGVSLTAVDNGGYLLTVDAASASALNGVLSGAGGLTTTGAGALSLSAANTYSGATTVGALASLVVTNDGALAQTSGVSNSGALDISGAGSEVSTASVSGSGAVNLGAKALSLSAATGGISGVISGVDGVLNLKGGALTLSGANTYTGATHVDAGTLTVSSNAGLGTADGGTTVASGASLVLDSASVADALSLSGTGVGDAGALRATGSSAVGGAVSLAADTTVDVGTGSLALSSTVDGAQALSVIGSGGLTLGGAVGGTTALSSLTVGSGVAVSVNGGSVETTGAQSYGSTVSLGDDTSLIASTVSLSGALTGNDTHALTVTGDAEVNAAISGVSTVSVSGTTALGANVTSTGNQSYTGAVTLTADSTVAAGAGDITISATLDGAQSLTATTSGDLMATAAWGGVTPLSAVNLTASALSLHDVSSQGAQTYTGTTTTNSSYVTQGAAVTFDGPVVFNDALVVDTTNAGASPAGAAVSFNSTLSAAEGNTQSVDIAAGTSGDVSFSGAVSAARMSVSSAADIDLQHASNTVQQLAVTSASGAVTVVNAQALNLDGVDAGSQLDVRVSSGDLSLSQAVSAGGDVLLASLAGNFASAAGVNGVSSDAGRWLVYSANPELDARDGLVPEFKAYNTDLGDSLPAATAGESGFVYRVAPQITPELVGEVRKTYDGDTTATNIVAGNYQTTTGALDGDLITLNNPTSGTYDTKHGGTGKDVTVTGLSITSQTASDAAIPVYGYTLASTTATDAVGVVDKAMITVVGLVPYHKTYDGTTTATLSTVVAAANGVFAGDEVTLVSATGYFDDKHVGDGKTVTANNIILGGVDKDNYQMVPVTGLSANITARSLFVQASDGVDKVYDGTVNGTVTLTDNRVAGDELIFTYDGSFLDKNIGTNKFIGVTNIQAHGADAGNYTYNTTTAAYADITAKALNIGASPTSRAYDGTTDVQVTLTDERATGDDLTVSFTEASFENALAGLGKTVTVNGITVTGDDVGNYTFETSATGLAEILGRVLTISGLTPQSRVYNAATAVTVDVSGANFAGVVEGDEVLLGDVIASFADKHVGTDKLVSFDTLEVLGAQAGNYTLTVPTTLTASITPKSVSMSGLASADKVYDGTTVAMVQGSALLKPAVSVVNDEDLSVYTSDDVVLSGSVVANFNDANVMDATTVSFSGLSLTGADATNYILLPHATVQQAITPKALSVSGLGADDKVYDGGTQAVVTGAAVLAAPVAVGASSSDDGRALSGDDVTVVGDASAVFASRNVGNGIVVSFDGLTLSGTSASNYSLNAHPTTSADISAKTLTVSGISATNKVYDGGVTATVSSASAVLDGLVSGDDVALSATGVFGDANVGTGKTVTLSSSYSGADLGNYSITDQSETTADISAKTLTVSGITVANKNYDAGVSAMVEFGSVSYDGLLAGDDVQLSNVAGVFVNKHVGINKLVSLSSTYRGADLTNYSVVDQNTAQATITPKALSVSGIMAQDKVYDGSIAAGLDVTQVVYGGLLAGDDLSISSVIGTFADKNVGTAKAVTLTSSYSGADVANYAINDQATSAADITRRSLTLSGLRVSDKTFDGTTQATVSTSQMVMSGLIANDDLSVTFDAQFDSAEVGFNKAVQASATLVGLDAGNYTLDKTFHELTGVVNAQPAEPPVALPQLDEPSQTDTLVNDEAWSSAATAPEAAPAVEVSVNTQVVANSVAQGVTVEVASSQVNVNQAAVVNVGVPGQLIQEGSPFGFQLPESIVAADVNAGDISVSRVDGGEMPSWLTFDAQSRTFVSDQVPAGALPLKLLVIVNGKATEVVISEKK